MSNEQPTAGERAALCAELNTGKLRPLLRKEAAELIESQAARIAELEKSNARCRHAIEKLFGALRILQASADSYRHFL